MDQPEITYPCPWAYRIVGKDEDEIRTLVARVVGERPYELTPSRESKEGNYVSLHLALEVRDQADRDEIFRALQADENVKLVL